MDWMIVVVEINSFFLWTLTRSAAPSFALWGGMQKAAQGQS
jgi:hypothetical protein